MRDLWPEDSNTSGLDLKEDYAAIGVMERQEKVLPRIGGGYGGIDTRSQTSNRDRVGQRQELDFAERAPGVHRLVVITPGGDLDLVEQAEHQPGQLIALDKGDHGNAVDGVNAVDIELGQLFRGLKNLVLKPVGFALRLILL